MSTDLHSLWGAIQRGDTREIASHLIPQTRSNPGTVSASLQQKGLPTAGIGTADAGTPRCTSCGAPMYALYDSCTQCLTVQSTQYPVTCRARYYDAASRILEEEGRLLRHDNANELGALIEQWIAKARENLGPR